jgi:hypothetical protein
MIKKFNKFYSDDGVKEDFSLSTAAKLSLYKKSQKYGIATNILESVYYRGYFAWNNDIYGTPEQHGFDRVNSFCSGGAAYNYDKDLVEGQIGSETKNKLEYNPDHLPTMELPWHPNCPTSDKRREFQKQMEKKAKEEDKLRNKLNKESYTEPTSNNFINPNSRFVGTDELTHVYTSMTPGQTRKTIKKVIRDLKK